MSTPIEALNAAMTIGNDAIFQVVCGNQRINWLGALMRAIQDDLKTGKGINALELASLGQYLVDDNSYATDIAADLQKKLDEIQDSEGRVYAPQNANPTNRGAHGEGEE